MLLHNNATPLQPNWDTTAIPLQNRSNVYLGNRGTMVMPATLSLIFADRSQTTVKLPIEMWNLGNTFNHCPPEKKRVIRAELDQRQALPDDNRENNVCMPPFPSAGGTVRDKLIVVDNCLASDRGRSCGDF